MRTIPDLVFWEHAGRALRLDLLLPDCEGAPLAVVIHGGGWREGNRKDEGLEWLVNKGFAIARIEYRHSREAVFPAQLEDCRSAVEWLEKKRMDFRYSGQTPAVIGTSAGGTLALLLAAEKKAAAVVAYCAPADFPLRAQTQPHLTETPGGTVHDLLGGPVADNLTLARMASPACQEWKDCPPLLLIHGTADQQVLPDQPLSMLRTALEAGVEASLIAVPGAPHCGPLFHADWVQEHVLNFLNRHCGNSQTI
jgi:acetyl esterase/lipase